MATLYELTSELASLLDAIEAGDIPEEAIADTLEGMQGEINEKIDRVCDAIKSLDTLAADISAEEKRLEARRKRKEAAADRMRAYLHAELDKLGIAKHESARHVVSFRRSSKVIVSDADKLRAWCADNNRLDLIRVKTAYEPDKVALAKALEKGEIPYCEIQENKRIQIG
jgi:hypothetical protein